MVELEAGFCCAMRQHFLIGIVGTRKGDAPVDVADFMVCFEPPVIAIKFCPFCGKAIGKDNNQMRTVVRTK